MKYPNLRLGSFACALVLAIAAAGQPSTRAHATESSGPTPAQLSLRLLPGVELAGQPGTTHVVQSNPDPDASGAWKSVAFVRLDTTNQLFVDTRPSAGGRQFYRALAFPGPTNLVYVPPTTFRMGSSTNDFGRSLNEGPETTVKLTRGFWIARFEVTQGEYLDLMRTNPSVFPGDLRRPISNVTWPDANEYCARLTERELAAGRIPPGTRYRLPTEAEWECAARAGTSTRFSHGEDPDFGATGEYTWHLGNAGLTVHTVGLKRPNPWGLYDMGGNVWEWCLDWYGSLPGGVVVDPQGPPTSAGDWKVMRGGAYDFPESSCRSASRGFYAMTPFHHDSDLGFRVVLSCP